MCAAGPKTISLGATELSLRSAVSLHELRRSGTFCLYLSIYGDEIERRATSFWEHFRPDNYSTSFAQLELTDAVVVIATNGEVVVARGAAAAFPLYCSTVTSTLRLSTSLPIDQAGVLSAHALLSAFACAWLHATSEPNAVTATPLHAWRRVRRGFVTKFQDGQFANEQAIDFGFPTATDLAGIRSHLRGAFQHYQDGQRSTAAAILELSGGVDSTLAGSIPDRTAMIGLSVDFPYYEFRFESALQVKTAHFLGIPRFAINGTSLLPYAPAKKFPRMDEPAPLVTGMRHTEQIAEFAQQNGIGKVYVGHGGDQCFATDLTADEVTSLAIHPEMKALSSPAMSIVRSVIAKQRNRDWAQRKLGTYLWEPRADAWIKETYGVLQRTPFSDLRMFATGLAWSRYSESVNAPPSKRILSETLSEYLPQEVVTRRGKVPYNGIWARAYEANEGHISSTIESTAGCLEKIGLSPSFLVRRAHDLARFKKLPDRELLAAYGISIWLLAWGLHDEASALVPGQADLFA